MIDQDDAATLAMLLLDELAQGSERARVGEVVRQVKQDEDRGLMDAPESMEHRRGGVLGVRLGAGLDTSIGDAKHRAPALRGQSKVDRARERQVERDLFFARADEHARVPRVQDRFETNKIVLRHWQLPCGLVYCMISHGLQHKKSSKNSS